MVLALVPVMSPTIELVAVTVAVVSAVVPSPSCWWIENTLCVTDPCHHTGISGAINAQVLTPCQLFPVTANITAGALYSIVSPQLATKLTRSTAWTSSGL